MRLLATALLLSAALLGGCATSPSAPAGPLLVAPERGNGDLGLVIERESGSIGVLDTTARTRLGNVDGLGDLSHASVVFSRDDHKVSVIDTQSFQTLATLPAKSPSGIFFTSRAARTGF